MEWISVKRRLPAAEDANGYGDILVWCNDGHEAMYLLESYEKITDYWDVTHWAKIEPPKPNADPQQ